MFDFGDDLDPQKDYAWFYDKADEIVEEYAHRVEQKRPSAWGLFDMHGNVFEWCSDWYGGDYYRTSPLVDPRGPSTGSDRVFRGGSWDSYARFCRSADRNRVTPGLRNCSLGFRVLCSSIK